MTTAQRFEALFTKARINVRRVTVLGVFVHIDTYNKYRSRLFDAMTQAGYSLVYEKDGVHLDDVYGFRMVFRVKGL